MKKFKLIICIFFLVSCKSYSISEQNTVETYVNGISQGDFYAAASVVDKKQLQDFHLFFVDLAKQLEDKGKYNEFTSGFLAKYATFNSLRQEDPVKFFAHLLSFSDEMIGIPTNNTDGYRFVGTINDKNQKAYAVVVFSVIFYNQKSEMPVLVPLVVNHDKTSIAIHPNIQTLVKALPMRVQQRL